MRGAGAAATGCIHHSAPSDAHVVANGDGERVDDVAGGGVQVLERFAQGVEHGPEHVGKPVQMATEPALIQGFHAVVLAHIGGGRAPVAAEVAGGQQGRGQDFGVADLASLVGRSAGRGRAMRRKSSRKQYMATVCSVMVAGE